MAYVGPRGIPLSGFLAWDPADQDAALEWAAHEARRCSSCGHHPDAGPRHHHVEVCPGCAERQRMTESEQYRTTRGAHVVPVSGRPGECQWCRDEVAEHLERRAEAAERRRAEQQQRG
jgi:hypothetical protein